MLDFSFSFNESELFAVPAPLSASDAVPAPTADWPGRPYRPFWDAVRGRPDAPARAGKFVEKVIDGWLTDRTEAPPRRVRRSVHRSLAELSSKWRTEVQLASLHAKPRSKSDSYRFVVVGDAEPGRFKLWRKLWNEEGVFGRQLQLINARSADFTLQLGDMVSRGLASQFEKFLTGLEAAGLASPYLTVLGNHDRHFPHGNSDASVYRQVFGAPNYAFDRGDYRFVVTDTSDEGLTQARLRWLDKVLGTARGRRKLVFTHKPPKQFARWTSAGIGGFARGSAEFLRLMSRHGVSRVYMGHIHGFGIQEHRGVRYILTGGGGSPLFPSGAPQKFHHHIVVEAGPQGLRETVIRLDGSEFSLPVWR
jgi:hypothetical protein